MLKPDLDVHDIFLLLSHSNYIKHKDCEIILCFSYNYYTCVVIQVQQQELTFFFFLEITLQNIHKHTRM